MAVDWDTWQRQMRQGGFGTTAIPGLPDTGMASPSMAWAGWELGQPQQQMAAPQQTTNWGQVAAVSEAPAANPWAYQSGNPFGMEFSQAAPETAAMTQAPGPNPGEVTTTVTGGGLPSPAALGPLLTGAATPTSTAGGGTGASWSGQDYKLPSGEVLPGSASFTLDILGKQVRAPGYYDPGSAQGGRPQAIFQTAQGMEDAMGRFSRRLSDAVRGGADPNDPNIIYRELARVRDDAMVALGLRADDPQLAAKLRAATGFVHLDRFVRGANGETGYTAAPGTTPGTTGAPATPGTPAAPAAPGGNNVVAPAYDPTGGGGQGGTVPGQTPGGAGNPLMNEALASNQALRTAMLLEKLGIGSPMARRNMFTGGVGQRLAQVMDPWMKTQGLQGGDPMANIEGLINQLSGYFGQGGGGMGRVAGDARQAAQFASTDPRTAGLPDDEMLAMLTGFNQLANLPQNPWMQRAYGNLQDELAAQYASFNLQPGKLGSTDILGYIKDNPLFNFMTGR